MLKEEEKKEIEQEVSKLPRRNAAGLEALRIVQEHRGWISDESVSDISQFLGMTPAEIDSLATFYNLIYRKPVGRHVILLCDSISCWIQEQDTLSAFFRNHLGIEFGQTTEDGRFTLLPVACLGACEKAPAMMVDEDLHVHLDGEKIKKILEKYR